MGYQTRLFPEVFRIPGIFYPAYRSPPYRRTYALLQSQNHSNGTLDNDNEDLADLPL